MTQLDGGVIRIYGGVKALWMAWLLSFNNEEENSPSVFALTPPPQGLPKTVTGGLLDRLLSSSAVALHSLDDAETSIHSSLTVLVRELDGLWRVYLLPNPLNGIFSADLKHSSILYHFFAPPPTCHPLDAPRLSFCRSLFQLVVSRQVNPYPK